MYFAFTHVIITFQILSVCFPKAPKVPLKCTVCPEQVHTVRNCFLEKGTLGRIGTCYLQAIVQTDSSNFGFASLKCKKLEFGVFPSCLFDSGVSWHIPYQQSWFIKFKHGKIWSHPTPGGTRRPHNIFNENIFGPSKNIHKQWKHTCHLSFAFCLPFSSNLWVKTLCPTHFNPVQEAQVLSSTTHSRRSSTTLWDLPSGTHCTDQATTLSLP